MTTILTLLGRLALAAAVTLALPIPGFAQDDATPGKLEDGSGRAIGRAAVLESPSDYGLYFKLWLDNGARLRILYPSKDSRRDAPAQFTFREFTVDPRNPNKSGDETGSGIATLEVARLTRTGNTESFSGSMQLTSRAVGDNDVPVSEPAQRFKIVLQ